MPTNHGPRSKHWKKKADDLWSLIVRSVGHCEICGREGQLTKEGKPVKGLNAHHLIGRSNLKYRHDLNNGICLCVRCHKWSTEFKVPHVTPDGIGTCNFKIAAHGDLDQQRCFWEWIEVSKPATYKWYQEAKENKKTVDIDYNLRYNELMEMDTPDF